MNILKFSHQILTLFFQQQSIYYNILYLKKEVIFLQCKK